MDDTIHRLIRLFKKREGHIVVVGGNIYDPVFFDNYRFEDFAAFVTTMTMTKIPSCVAYQSFRGLQVIRGEEKQIRQFMGLDQEAETPANPLDENEKLIMALKNAKKDSTGSAYPTNPSEVFVCLDKLLAQSTKPVLLMIDYADQLFPSLGGLSLSGIALANWARSREIRERGHLIVLFSRRIDDVHEMLRDRSLGMLQFHVPKPDCAARVKFLRNHSIAIDLANIIGQATAGLAYKDLEILVLRRLYSNDIDEALRIVTLFKREILRVDYHDVLEIMDVAHGFECVGGLERIVAKLQRVAAFMRQGKTSLVPQGVLFMGPPGTGKTLVAEAFAKEAGLNFVRPLDIKSMLVGESERRMSRFLHAVKDLAPVAVFIDEFDQNQGQRGSFDGDSGVSRNLFKKMLEIMSDSTLRGKILWLLATNRPDLIDPAMKRPGRCDLRIPFLPPDARQMELICQVALQQYPDIKAEITDWVPYVKTCRDYTGAEMVEVVRRAWEHANENEHERITDEDMVWACEDYRPQIIERLQVVGMTALAILECSSQSLLPSHWRELVDGYIKELLLWDKPDHAVDKVRADLEKSVSLN